jgi:hypothetical protein
MRLPAQLLFRTAFHTGLAALLLAACNDSSAPAEDELFTRYVAIGGSTTAGMQSSGISATTQQQAYPTRLAILAGGTINVPLISGTGCPSPATTPLGNPTLENSCTLTASLPARAGKNVAVPTAKTIDAVLLNNSLALQTLFLGAQTQLQAALAADPTLVTVQLGDEDVLEAALLGTLGPIAPSPDSALTTLARFNARYGELVDAIDDETTIETVVLIGVLNPVRFTPLLQPGAYYYLARDVATNRFQGKLVNANCSPVNSLGQPNPLASNLVSMRIIAAAAATEINCDPGSSAPFLLSATEMQIVQARVDAFNASISAFASEHGWIFLNPNTLLESDRAATNEDGRFQLLRKCQLLATATTAGQFQTAVLNSCPITGSTAAPNFFGLLVSFDGVNFSAEYHQLLAGTIFVLLPEGD